MSSQSKPICPLGVNAAAVLSACRFVTVAGAYPAAGGDTLGVTRVPALAVGDRVLVDTLGTAQVEAGGVIAAGAEVQTDATGKAITKDAGKARGKALEGATASGKVIEVFLYAY